MRKTYRYELIDLIALVQADAEKNGLISEEGEPWKVEWTPSEEPFGDVPFVDVIVGGDDLREQEDQALGK